MHAFAEPAVILSILTVNALVGISQSRSAEDSLDALKKLQSDTACVLRDGEWQSTFPSKYVVPGDILYFRVGDKVCADCRLIALKTTTLSSEEGSLTGESATVEKDIDVVADAQATISSKSNILFSGTLITNGACIGLVIGTGQNTEMGKINLGVRIADADNEGVKTPLGKKLDEFGAKLTKIITVICAGVFLASIPRFSSPVFKSRAQGAVHYAKVAVALGVAAIPEGLPMVITLCLSLGTGRMAKRNVIVRKLPSVETLGCTSVICTDKTGTLTTNQMTVKALVSFRANARGVALLEGEVEGISYEPIGQIVGYADVDVSTVLGDIAMVSSLCNEAQIEYRDGQYGRMGEPTEAALKVLAEKIGVANIARSTGSPAVLAHQFSDYWESNYKKLAILEFTRDRKSMGVLVKAVIDGRNRLLVKGAAEVVIGRCSHIKLDDESVVPITLAIRESLNRKFADMSRRPLRCLALAYKEGPGLGELNDIKDVSDLSNYAALFKNTSNFVTIETDMVLVGFCGIKDPARPEAAEAIRKCKTAGVRVMMMTGDSKETAVAIAKDVNIFTADDSAEHIEKSAFTGKEFFSLPEAQQLEYLESGNKVFCRTEPQDKQRLISMLEKLGEIIAMTGDGVNDAPALSQADIGIAMGITGTEVSKGVADMILADDNFASIVAAVEEGRNIYSNMQAFVCFLISCNIGEIATIFISTVLGIPEPLTPLHLLWVNLVTDGPPATALGFNPADPDAMSKPPRAKSEGIMSNWLLCRYVVTGLYVGFATIGAFVWWYADKGVTLKQLMAWNNCLLWSDGDAATLSDKLTSRVSVHSFCDIFTSTKSIPQSMSLSVLVTIEMLKALSAVSLDSSIFRVPPWKNPWLLLGVALPFSLHLLVLYVPLLAHVFGLAPLLKEEWKMVLLFSAPILLLDEIMKAVGRRISDESHKVYREQKARSRPGSRQAVPPHF